MKYILTALIVLSLLGCATAPSAPPLNTPSGHPEVLIKNRSPQEIRDLLVAHGFQSGYELRYSTDYELAFTMPQSMVTTAQRISYGTRFDPVPDLVGVFQTVAMGNDTKLYIKMYMYQNVGSIHEKKHSLGSNAEKQELQTMLLQFSEEFSR